MFVPPWSCAYRPHILARISPSAAPPRSTLNFKLSAAFPLTPLFPLLTGRAPVSPLFPLHTQIPGGDPLEFPRSAPQPQVLLSISMPSPKSGNPVNHYRFTYLSHKCRRADILISGISQFSCFLFSIFQFLVVLSLLKTDNCELITKMSARRHFSPHPVAGRLPSTNHERRRRPCTSFGALTMVGRERYFAKVTVRDLNSKESR